jgi:hypothetical protein
MSDDPGYQGDTGKEIKKIRNLLVALRSRKSESRPTVKSARESRVSPGYASLMSIK